MKSLEKIAVFGSLLIALNGCNSNQRSVNRPIEDTQFTSTENLFGAVDLFPVDIARHTRLYTLQRVVSKDVNNDKCPDIVAEYLSHDKTSTLIGCRYAYPGYDSRDFSAPRFVEFADTRSSHFYDIIK